MPGLLGTDVLARVTHQPVVIFTTAYAQHAAAAFELGALDYLLKPFGAERLATAMERARSILGEPAVVPALERMREALGARPLRRLFVRSGGAIVPVAVDGVAWFESWGDYVAAHAGKSRHVIHVALTRLEARLDPRVSCGSTAPASSTWTT